MNREMKWKKSSPELGKLLEAVVISFPCDRKIMFGSPVFMINRNMFAGVHEDNIFIRLSENDRNEILREFPQARPFEPVKGHVMKEYVVVPRVLYEHTKAFKEWLKRSHAFAAAVIKKSKGRGK